MRNENCEINEWINLSNESGALMNIIKRAAKCFKQRRNGRRVGNGSLWWQSSQVLPGLRY